MINYFVDGLIAVGEEASRCTFDEFAYLKLVYRKA